MPRAWILYSRKEMTITKSNTNGTEWIDATAGFAAVTTKGHDHKGIIHFSSVGTEKMSVKCQQLTLAPQQAFRCLDRKKRIDYRSATTLTCAKNARAGSAT
jgi:acetylornithine/succinyldiaminopimelate/putrescine aminotransferase